MIRRSMIWGSLLSGLMACAVGSAQQMAPAYGLHGNSTYIPPGGWQQPPAHRPHAGWEQPGLPYDPELLPRDHGFLYDLDSPIDLDIREELAGAGFRFEYLNWRVRNANNVLFGAPLIAVPNPNEDFEVGLPDGTSDFAFTPDLNDVGEGGQQDGFKGTFVLPIYTGSVETSWWILEDGVSTYNPMEAGQSGLGTPNGGGRMRPDPALGFGFPTRGLLGDDRPAFIATGLLLGGGLSDTVLLADEYNVSYRNRAWSGDVNYYYPLPMVPTGWKVEPSLGFRYMNFDEQLDQNFLFDNRQLGLGPAFTRLAIPIESRILTDTQNDLYGAQVGVRIGMQSKWLDLTFEPRAILGANHYLNVVQTENLRDSVSPNVVADGTVRSSNKGVMFWPALDMGLRASIHLTEYASLTVGYNLFFTGNINRAPYATYYNDNGIGNPPAVVARRSTDQLLMHGLTVGMEFFIR
jgi:hypothetical protein